MQLFYSTKIQNGLVFLEEEEARHCSQVLRKRQGDILQVVDGNGNLFEGPIVEMDKKRVVVAVQKSIPEFGKRSGHLHIAIAPTKNIDRLEWFLEKATEIGIDEISLLQCEHSERDKIRIDRLEKVLVSAMKQSLSAYLPKLFEPQPFSTFVKRDFQNSQKFIGFCGAELPHLKDLLQPGSPVLVMIGPEGDFSKKEFDLALENGFHGISLGATRLRTETAGIVAAVLANLAR